MSLQQKTAKRKIEAKLQEAYAAIAEAEDIADEAGIGFGFSVSYGMGGWYQPKSKDDSTLEDGWRSSSQSC